MRAVITISFLFITLYASAQKDTLVVPAGKYGYVKIGDKVYKINYSLEESKPEFSVPRSGILTFPQGIMTVPAATNMPLTSQKGNGKSYYYLESSKDSVFK